MSKYGFIITRHVNSEKTNKYWNHCINLLKTYYPTNEIVVIDDNSDQTFVKTEHPYTDIKHIQSEWVKRGELLPYIYYLKYKWFPSAVIIHDSLFVHSRIHFEFFDIPVIPLWHHNYDKENLNNILRIASTLTNNSELMRTLNNKFQILGLNADKINLCFGCQCFIKLDFLEKLHDKYII
jgi:hypothetical protein